MTAKEREQLFRLKAALGAMRGVSNPADTKGHATYYEDMERIVGRVSAILGAIIHPAYEGERDEEFAALGRLMRELDAKGRLHSFSDWWKEGTP